MLSASALCITDYSSGGSLPPEPRRASILGQHTGLPCVIICNKQVCGPLWSEGLCCHCSERGKIALFDYEIMSHLILYE